jgi:hypothetical protein
MRIWRGECGDDSHLCRFQWARVRRLRNRQSTAVVLNTHVCPQAPASIAQSILYMAGVDRQHDVPARSSPVPIAAGYFPGREARLLPSSSLVAAALAGADMGRDAQAGGMSLRRRLTGSTIAASRFAAFHLPRLGPRRRRFALRCRRARA